MSAYKNFVQDFPERCRDVLDHCVNTAESNDRDVTLLLSVATPGLIMPFERLKPEHPSQDSTRFNKAGEALDTELQKKCKNSDLWQNQTWQYKQLNALQGDPDNWNLGVDIQPINNHKVEKILRILRNALAHGNIWTTGNPINTIVFVSLVDYKKQNGPFHSLQCSPSQFEDFFRKWATFLSSLNLPMETSQNATNHRI